MFQIFFNMTYIDIRDTFSLPGLHGKMEQPELGWKINMTMYVNDGPQGMDLLLVYNQTLFEHSHMERLVEQYVYTLEQMVANPDHPIDDVSLVTSGDAVVLPDVSAPLDRHWHDSVPAAMRRVARRSPDRIAVVDGSHRWTYGVLAAQMVRLAAWLHIRHVG